MNEEGLAMLLALLARIEPPYRPTPKHEPAGWYRRRNAHRTLPRFTRGRRQCR